MRRGWRGEVIAVVVLGLVGCTGGSSSSAEAGEVRSSATPDAEVFMNLDATPARIAAVRRALVRSPLVEQFAFLTQVDAYREFRRLFADQPDLVETTTPDQLPTSFPVRVRTRADRDQFVRTFERLPGVDEVKTPGGHLDCEDLREDARSLRPADEIEAFMVLGATEAEIAGVRAVVETSPLVGSFRFLNQEDAYREFQRIFADKPKLIADTRPEMLPVSFKITLHDARTRAEIVAEIQALHGVEEVVLQPVDGPAQALLDALSNCPPEQ